MCAASTRFSFSAVDGIPVSCYFQAHKAIVCATKEDEEGAEIIVKGETAMIRVQIQSDAQESALDIIRSAITAEASRLELGLKTTERHIRAFEERSSVTSETFLRDFASEDLADGDREYVCWAGELKLRERIAAQLKTLEGIQYAA
jgi:hypothetical protein